MHVVFIVLASVGVGVYPIGIPIGFLIMLRRDKKNTGTSPSQSSSSSSLDFLRADYKPDYYYYECVTLLEKLLMTGLLIFAKQVRQPGTMPAA